MKLTTINLIVQSIYDKISDTADMDEKRQLYDIANEATIYLRTALICEDGGGIDKAMEYFFGPHLDTEYKEWLTGVIATGPMLKQMGSGIDDVSVCGACHSVTKTTIDGFCAKCKHAKPE